MIPENYDKRKWNELGVADKFKLTLASALILSSIILGFLSFIWLTFIPGSVIATMGLFGSEALAILGIASYFHNELVKFETNVQSRLNDVEPEHRKHNKNIDNLEDEHN